MKSMYVLLSLLVLNSIFLYSREGRPSKGPKITAAVSLQDMPTDVLWNIVITMSKTDPLEAGKLLANLSEINKRFKQSMDRYGKFQEFVMHNYGLALTIKKLREKAQKRNLPVLVYAIHRAVNQILKEQRDGNLQKLKRIKATWLEVLTKILKELKSELPSKDDKPAGLDFTSDINYLNPMVKALSVPEILQLLINAGGDVNKKRGLGASPLLYNALENGYIQVAHILLENKNINPNLTDFEDFTPLMALVTGLGNGKVTKEDAKVLIKKLIQKGADPSLQSGDDTTVYDIARAFNMNDIAIEIQTEFEKKQRENK